MGLRLGKIVKADSHIHYVCQVYGQHEVKPDRVPQPEHYALGNFVRVHMGEGQGKIIGVVYDTMLLNPDFGNLGPRLSPERELKVFSPDYLNERAVLVRIVAVGYIDVQGGIHQGVPRLAPSADSEVEELTSKRILAFHQTASGLNLAYLPVLLRQDASLVQDMVGIMLDRLAVLLPPESQVELDVLRDDLHWRTQIRPLGGTQ